MKTKEKLARLWEMLAAAKSQGGVMETDLCVDISLDEKDVEALEWAIRKLEYGGEND